MKRLLAILGSIFLCAPVLVADDGRPRNIRIMVEYIEVPHGLVTEAMLSDDADSGPKLHARMRVLVKAKKARIMETSIISGRSGLEARAESIMEYIYPTESEPPILGPCGGLAADDELSKLLYRSYRVRPGWPNAFDTRNVGITLIAEPYLDQDRKIVHVSLISELVDLLRHETWLEHHDQWGDAPLRSPIFESLRLITAIALEDGKFGFLGLHTPTNPDGGCDTTRKIMLFVRADIIPIGT